MSETIRKPNTFYAAGVNNAMINTKDLTKDVWDYYWTSYSRGTDGTYNNPNINNIYLDVYKQQRPKSVFDPCPYGFRVSVNGTCNKLNKIETLWVNYSYIGGVTWRFDLGRTWFLTGYRWLSSGILAEYGRYVSYHYSILHNDIFMCQFWLDLQMKELLYNNLGSALASPLRCIEDAKTRGCHLTTSCFMILAPFS